MYRLSQRVEHIMRRRGITPVLPGIARADKHRAHAPVDRRLNINGAIADKPALGQVQVQVRSRLKEHARGRLAALTADFELSAFAGKTALWMVRAEVDPVQE